MIYTLMNKNNPVIDFETQMGTILRITDTWNEEYLPIGTRTKTGIDVKTLNHWWNGRSIPASISIFLRIHFQKMQEVLCLEDNLAAILCRQTTYLMGGLEKNG